MRRWVYMGVIAAVFLAAPLVWRRRSTSAPPRTGEDPAHEPEEISRTRVDLGTPGRGVGTPRSCARTCSTSLKDKPIGYTEYVCTFTTSFARSCTVTIFMPRGRLIAGGSIRYRTSTSSRCWAEHAVRRCARTLTVIRTTRRPPAATSCPSA